MRLLMAAAIGSCLIGSAIARPSPLFSAGASEIGDVHFIAKKGKGPDCFARCTGKGHPPQRCNKVCQ